MSRSPGRPLGEALPVAAEVGRRHVSPRRHPDLLGDTFCPVIAVLLLPGMEPDPAIVAAARRSNVHLPWRTDHLMDRLAQISASKDCRH